MPYGALLRFCLCGYFFLGIIAIIFPPLMPQIIAHFGLGLASAGLVFPAKAVGSLLGNLFSGITSDVVGRKPLLVGGALLQAVGLGLSAAAGSWPVFLIGFVMMGFSQGAVSAAINALVVDLSGENRGRALNLLHGVYSIGAALSPVVIALVLGSGRHWREIFASAAFAWLILGGAALILSYPERTQVGGKKQLLNLEFVKHDLALPLLAVAFIYNGVAWALLGWVNTYLQESGGISPLLANSMVTLFYVGLTSGRFACAAVAERLKYGQMLLVLAVGTVVSYPLVIFGQSPLLVALGLILSGLFMSGLYPTALAYANSLFPALAGTVVSTMSLAMTLGTMLPPWWTGVIAEAWSFQAAIASNYLLLIPLLWIAVTLLRWEGHTRQVG